MSIISLYQKKKGNVVPELFEDSQTRAYKLQTKSKMIKHASVLIILRVIYLKFKNKCIWILGGFAFKKIKYILKCSRGNSN